MRLEVITLLVGRFAIAKSQERLSAPVCRHDRFDFAVAGLRKQKCSSVLFLAILKDDDLEYGMRNRNLDLSRFSDCLHGDTRIIDRAANCPCFAEFVGQRADSSASQSPWFRLQNCGIAFAKVWELQPASDEMRFTKFLVARWPRFQIKASPA